MKKQEVANKLVKAERGAADNWDLFDDGSINDGRGVATSEDREPRLLRTVCVCLFCKKTSDEVCTQFCFPARVLKFERQSSMSIALLFI